MTKFIGNTRFKHFCNARLIWVESLVWSLGGKNNRKNKDKTETFPVEASNDP